MPGRKYSHILTSMNFDFVRLWKTASWVVHSKAYVCNAGDPGSIPGSGRPPGEGNGNPATLFLAGESHGQRSLADYGPWGLKESDTTERLTHTHTHTHTHTLPPNINALNFIFEYFEFYFSSNIHTRKRDELHFFYQSVTLIKFTRLMAKTHWWWRLEDKFLKYRIIYFMLKVNSVKFTEFTSDSCLPIHSAYLSLRQSSLSAMKSKLRLTCMSGNVIYPI